MVAVGGYGRRELCPFSDIDLLLLVDHKASLHDMERTLRVLLYPLWDKGFTVAYSVRTVRQALSDARDDFFLTTSLLDARYLCGRKDLFDDLTASFSRDGHIRDTRTFVRCLEAHVARRYERFGDASYNLEPDIKDGSGGLRDHHCLMWITKAASFNPKAGFVSSYLSDRDRHELENAADHLLRIRYILHELAGRKTDRLSFEYQKPLAEKLGFRGNGNESAAELLMRHFHCSAQTIKSITGSIRTQLAVDFGLLKKRTPRLMGPDLKSLDGLISFADPGQIPRRPWLLMEIFVHMSEHGGTLANQARTLIQNSLGHMDEARHDHRLKKNFVRILMGRHCLDALTAMLETGMLERFMPEFSSIRGRTQVDAFHTWTVDLHSIRTAHEMCILSQEIPGTYGLVKERETLHLAALLHDIGKGCGRPHAVIGASLVRDIASWLGFTEKNADLAAFLVHHHLLLPDTAYRRDLSEEKVALECARMARDEQTLAMLYLLSMADSRATGPRAWNEWKAMLLHDLFSKALHSLQRGVLRDPNTMVVLEDRWNRLIREIPDEFGSRQGGRLWVLPQAYVIHTDLEVIKRHLYLGSTIKSLEDITLDILDRGDHVRVTVITRDRPGLFAVLAGIFAMNHLTIISAKVFTWLDGIAVDTFHVVPPWENYARWDRIETLFKAACSGDLDVGKGVEDTRPLWTVSRMTSSSRPQVSVDNAFSDFFTLIEVRSPRRFGMLYYVAREISSLGLDIHRAFLTHTGELCTDVFYVVDEYGEKITERDTITGLERKIAQALENLKR